jgi:hypothetical protein
MPSTLGPAVQLEPAPQDEPHGHACRHQFGLLIEQHDATLAVDNHHRVGGGLQQTPKLCFGGFGLAQKL